MHKDPLLYVLSTLYSIHLTFKSSMEDGCPVFMYLSVKSFLAPRLSVIYFVWIYRGYIFIYIKCILNSVITVELFLATTNGYTFSSYNPCICVHTQKTILWKDISFLFKLTTKLKAFSAILWPTRTPATHGKSFHSTFDNVLAFFIRDLRTSCTYIIVTRQQTQYNTIRHIISIISYLRTTL